MTPPDMNHPGPHERPQRILVTGGAGFIGSHLVERLLAAGHRLTVVDNLSTGRRDNLPCSAPGLEFIELQLREALPTLRSAEPFDEIYHLAAAVGVTRVIERPIESIEANVLDTAATLDFASAQPSRGGPPPRMLIASSSEVYGKGVKTPFAEDDDCVYGPTTAPRWSYACSKAIDEQLALAHHARHGLPVVIARLFNTVGPRQLGEYGMVLPRFVARVLAGEPPIVFGDGRQSRCFCDVRDVAPALPQLIRSEGCHGRVLNIGSKRSITIMDLARLVIETLAGEHQHKLEPRLMPYDEAYGPDFEDLHERVPDLQRIHRAIGFNPHIPLEATILDLARSMRSAPAQSPSEGVACP